MKKKKIWQSSSLNESNRSASDKIRDTLLSVLHGKNSALSEPDKLFDLLVSEFEKIENLNGREELEMLAWFLNCSAFCDVECSEDLAEDFENLFSDAVALFTEKAKSFDDREYVVNLLHDLIVNSIGEEAREEVFLSAKEFLSEEEMRRVIDDVLNSIRGRGLENEDEIFAGLLDVADSLGDPSLYEKISLLRDPDVSNHTKIEVANAYYVAGDVANANRVLNEVENPKNEDEEEFLDLKVGILFREEKKDEALKLAEELYEKFPKAFHLMSLCNVVSKSRREELLNAHENFRSGENVDADYVNMLITLQEFDRLENYLGKRQKQTHQLDAEIREGLAERLISVNQKALAKKFRSI